MNVKEILDKIREIHTENVIEVYNKENIRVELSKVKVNIEEYYIWIYINDKDIEESENALNSLLETNNEFEYSNVNCLNLIEFALNCLFKIRKILVFL